jgi:hypothetical protein
MDVQMVIKKTICLRILLFIIASPVHAMEPNDTQQNHAACQKIITSLKDSAISNLMPFPYHSMTQEEKDQSYFITENEYAVLQPGQSAVLFPLEPCFAIVVMGAGTAWCCHKHFAGSMFSVSSQIKKVFNTPDKITQITIFSVEMDQTAYNNDGKTKWRKWHQQKSQNDELKFIQKELCAGLSINPSIIKSQL